MAQLGLRRPLLLIGLVVGLTLIAGALIPGIGVSTSRTGLISDDDPQQALLLDFYERFGRPDSAVFLVSGGEPEARRAIVDQLQAKLEAEPDFKGRVLAHVEAETVAPLLLLQQPDALVQLRGRLPAGTKLDEMLVGGLPAWLGMLENQIYEQLEGAEDGEAEAQPTSPEQVDEGLLQLAMLARLLDAVVAGEDAMSVLASDARMEAQPGLDERGYLVTADGNNHLLNVFIELPSDEAAEVSPVVERIRAIRDEVMANAPEGMAADLTGMPALITDEGVILAAGMRDSTIATTLGISLLCLLLFRSFRQMVIALLPLGPGVIVTLAVIHLAYDDLNLITSSLFAVLLGLGIDFSVHAISRFNEEVRGGAETEAAVESAMVRAGPGVLTGAVVTAAAFLTSATTDFTAFGELGVVTAVGLIAVVVVTFALLPALLRRKVGATRTPPEPPGLAAVPGLLRKLQWPLLIGGLATAIGGGIALGQMGFNPRYFDFLPDETEASRALDRLEYDPLASPVFANMRAESVAQARDMTERLRELDSVAGVQSASDLLPALDDAQIASLRAGFADLPAPDFDALAKRETTAEDLAKAAGGVVDALDESRLAMSTAGLPTTAMDQTIAAFKALRDRAKTLDEAGQARLAALEPRAAAILKPAWETATKVAERGHTAPEDLPPLFARRYVSKDGQLLALYVVPSGKFWERDVALQFRKDMVEVDPGVCGLATVHVRHGEIIVEGFIRAAGMAAIFVVLILALDFRSLKDALLSLVPTVIGWLWMVGIMVLLGLRFDVANVVSMPLVLGIGIAFGVHMMHRCREVELEDSPMDGRLDTVVRGTGGAIAVAALTTMVGFAGLTISDYGGMQSFGEVMIIGIGACLVATVVVLPALLLVIRRVR